MSTGVIEKYYNERKEAIEKLLQSREISFANSLQDDFRKTLLLSCASYFEAEITEVFITFTKLKAGEQSILMHLIKNKALKRQYHTFFDWDKKNANAFFGLLGEDFLATAKRDVSASKELEKGISDFLELGSLRNQLVHKNFVSFPIEKTPDEIFAQYQSALLFLTWISNALNSA